jgi:hypothetical protein
MLLLPAAHNLCNPISKNAERLGSYKARKLESLNWRKLLSFLAHWPPSLIREAGGTANSFERNRGHLEEFLKWVV